MGTVVELFVFFSDAELFSTTDSAGEAVSDDRLPVSLFVSLLEVLPNVSLDWLLTVLFNSWETVSAVANPDGKVNPKTVIIVITLLTRLGFFKKSSPSVLKRLQKRCYQFFT